MRIAVSGPDGFIAWHTRCAIRVPCWGGDAVHLDFCGVRRPCPDDRCTPDRRRCHPSGRVNRAADDTTIAEVNPNLAQRLVQGLRDADVKVPVVFGNSIHSLGDSVFGKQSGARLRSSPSGGGCRGAGRRHAASQYLR